MIKMRNDRDGPEWFNDSLQVDPRCWGNKEEQQRSKEKEGSWTSTVPAPPHWSQVTGASVHNQRSGWAIEVLGE